MLDGLAIQQLEERMRNKLLYCSIPIIIILLMFLLVARQDGLHRQREITKMRQQISELQTQNTNLTEAFVLLGERWKIIQWDRLNDRQAVITIQSRLQTGQGNARRQVVVSSNFIARVIGKFPNINGREISFTAPRNFTAQYGTDDVLDGLLTVYEVK